MAVVATGGGFDFGSFGSNFGSFLATISVGILILSKNSETLFSHGRCSLGGERLLLGGRWWSTGLLFLLANGFSLS